MAATKILRTKITVDIDAGCGLARLSSTTPSAVVQQAVTSATTTLRRAVGNFRSTSNWLRIGPNWKAMIALQADLFEFIALGIEFAAAADKLDAATPPSRRALRRRQRHGVTSSHVARMGIASEAIVARTERIFSKAYASVDGKSPSALAASSPFDTTNDVVRDLQACVADAMRELRVVQCE